MWDYIKELSSVVVGQKILSFLDLKSIVWLERALASNTMQQTLRSFLLFVPTIQYSIQIPQQLRRLKWFQLHKCRISQGSVYLNKLTNAFDLESIENITLFVDGEVNPNTIPLLSDMTSENISEVCFNCEDIDIVIAEGLFARLKNLRYLEITCEECNWITAAMRGLQSAVGVGNAILLEKIGLEFMPEYLPDSAVAAIAKSCPRLLSLDINSDDITVASLLLLSEHKLPLEELKVTALPHFDSPLQVARCAHALSRIPHLRTSHEGDSADISSNTLTMTAPYLTGLSALCGNCEADHLLLPLFAQRPLPLRSVFLGRRSSATAAQVLQLLQRSGSHLQRLRLDNEACEVSDAFILAAVPLLPQLEQLVLSYYDKDFTEASLLALSEHCLQLEELDIGDYLGATEAVVLQLIRRCRYLRKLVVPLGCLCEDTVLALPVRTSQYSERIVLRFSPS